MRAAASTILLRALALSFFIAPVQSFQCLFECLDNEVILNEASVAGF